MSALPAGTASTTEVVLRRVSSSTLVGRADELAALDAAVGRMPAFAFVAGESGVGKSRLVSEFEARAEGAGVRVLVGHCLELGGTIFPYAPIVEALRPLGESLPDAASQPHVFEALLSLLDRLGPVALVIEDLHWADPSTRDFLVFLVGNALYTEELLAAADEGAGELPASLRDALLGRFERLPAAAQEVVRVAAVAERPIGHALLDAVLPGDVIDGAREAVARRLLVTQPDGTYAFRHALVGEAIYEDLLPGERTALHAALGRAIEADPSLLGDAHAATVPAELACHWSGAHDLRRRVGGRRPRGAPGPRLRRGAGAPGEGARALGPRPGRGGARGHVALERPAGGRRGGQRRLRGGTGGGPPARGDRRRPAAPTRSSWRACTRSSRTTCATATSTTRATRRSAARWSCCPRTRSSSAPGCATRARRA